MRKRDMYFLWAEIGMTASCIAVACLCGFLALRLRRDLRFALDDASKRLDVCERTCADAVCAARSLADGVAARSVASPDAEPDVAPQPQLLGFGQTRSRVARYIYGDYRMPDGNTERKFIARVPLTSEKETPDDSQE